MSLLKEKKLFITQSPLVTTLKGKKKEIFKNIVGKGVNATNQHFHLFPQCFLLFQKQSSIFESHLFCRLEILSIILTIFRFSSC